MPAPADETDLPVDVHFYLNAIPAKTQEVIFEAHLHRNVGWTVSYYTDDEHKEQDYILTNPEDCENITEAWDALACLETALEARGVQVRMRTGLEAVVSP